MTPYFDPELKPQDDRMNLKMQEGVLALLPINERFAPLIFDFNEPWKIDILDFMNRNYMMDNRKNKVSFREKFFEPDSNVAVGLSS